MKNPFGAGELAREAYRRAGHDLHRYPSTDHASLREALAVQYGLDAGRIVCGVGSDEIITFLCQGFAGPGDEVLYSQHGFPDVSHQRHGGGGDARQSTRTGPHHRC